jgi:hypothetical protein
VDETDELDRERWPEAPGQADLVALRFTSATPASSRRSQRIETRLHDGVDAEGFVDIDAAREGR